VQKAALPKPLVANSVPGIL
jgi:pre-mRNA-processing factor 19